MNGNRSHLIGRDISASQEQQGWGADVLDRLAADLQREFSKLAGCSARNLSGQVEVKTEER